MEAQSLDARDVVARVPDPRRHVVHYFGAYANIVRGKQKASRQAHTAPPQASQPPQGPLPLPAISPSAATLLHRWLEMIRRVFEVDTLVCLRCGSVMCVVSFITARSVIRLNLEVVKGPASFLYGQVAPGGIVNVITTSPHRQRNPG